MNPQGAAALAYARRGLLVFPVAARGKLPLIKSAHPEGDPARGICRGECGKDGHGLWDGTVDLDRVRAWWQRWPGANVGIRTGERFDVLDLDGAKGIASMAAFAAEHGIDLDRVPWVPTPGGGRHYYFAPTGLGNAAGLLKGVDWRGRGGYVVVGPSVHPNGKRYAEVPTSADRPPFVPAALRALLEPPKPEPAPPQPTFRPGDTTTRYARAALEGTQARILAAALGQRNDVAFKQAAALFGLVAGGVVNQVEATSMLEDAMRAVGLGAREIGATLASARRRGMARPRGIPADPAPPPKVPAPGAVLREDSFAAWVSGKPQVESRGHAIEPAVFPIPRLRELYRTLEFGSFIDPHGRRVREGVTHAALARHYDVAPRTIKRDLEWLERLGALTRQRRRAPGGKGGFVNESNRYVLHLDPAAVRLATIATPNRGDMPSIKTAGGIEGTRPQMSPQNQVEAVTTGKALSTGGVLQPVEGVDAARAIEPEPEPEPWPADAAGHLLPVRLDVPEADQLDHDPGAGELLNTIRGGLGEARVLGVVRNDEQDATAKLQAIHAGSAPLPDGWSWRARWDAEPVGECVRCGGEASTTGPDGRPWHAYCWGSAGTPPAAPTYQGGTRAHPRVLTLAGSLEDFHRAVNLLERDTCLETPCRPGVRCRRHTRRQRAEV